MLSILFPTLETLDFTYGSNYVFLSLIKRCNVDMSKIWFDLSEPHSATTCILYSGSHPHGKSLFKHRGYVTQGNPPFLCTHSPSAISKEHKLLKIVLWDIVKAYQIACGKVTIYPIYVETTSPTPTPTQKQTADIEGGMEGISMCGFTSAEKPRSSQVIVAATVEALDTICNQLTQPTIYQNGSYEAFIMAYVYGKEISISEDTMLMMWEMWAEMPKSLAFQASIFTNLPYYKDFYEGGLEEHIDGCGKDNIATMGSLAYMEPLLKAKPKAYAHYKFNLSLLEPFLYMTLRGIRYDSLGDRVMRSQLKWGRFGFVEGSKKEVELLEDGIEQLQAKIDAQVPYLGKTKIFATPKPKKDGTPSKREQKPPRREQEMNININSPDQMKTLLYSVLKLPFQYTGRGKDRRVCADEEALLNLGLLTINPIVRQLLELRRLKKQLSTLESFIPSEDGRIRASFNVVGAITGRVKCRKLPDKTGWAAQTITEHHRHLAMADPGMSFGQYDLAGADAWTVGAWANLFKDPTMLNDMRKGIKPAKMLVAMVKMGAKICSYSDEDLIEICRGVDSKSDDYSAAKKVQHGSAYGGKPAKIAAIIFKDSDGQVKVSEATCRHLQEMYFIRYPGVLRWQQHVKNIIESPTPVIHSASGFSRQFYNRPDANTVREALAHEPQANTTYACNLALRNMYYDTENRREDGSLIIEPLLVVHDAVCFQFPTEIAKESCLKIHQYFNNPLTIANQQITIPGEGKYGTSWGNLTEKI